MDQGKIKELLSLAVQRKATDIHLVTGLSPVFRIHGDLIPAEIPPYSAEDVKQMIMNMLSDKQKLTFRETNEIDFSYFGFKEFQFRVNAHIEKGNMAATFRITPTQIASMKELGLPPIVQELSTKRKGLLIFSGAAGSGKTTTMACMVNMINSVRKCKIITIEDPIEYIHHSKQSLIIQREVGSDTQSFASALKYALRQDPDVVVIGEMRDLESISMALTTAETGHLVLTTVHSPNAIETINRIIDVYPTGRQSQICAQLAENLIGVIGHCLVPRKESASRILVTEILIGTMAIRNMIRRGALIEIRGQLDAVEDAGTHSFEQCLADYVKKGIISINTAKEYSKYTDLLSDLLRDSETKNIFKMGLKSNVEQENQSIQPTKKRSEKILIIDNSEQDRKNMGIVLRNMGFEHILSAEKGKEALEKAKSFQPEVVVLDMGIYDMSSVDVCKELKALLGKNSKIIMITGNLQASDVGESQEAGADDFIIKTFEYELLTKAIEKLIKSVTP
ncbi:MAG TPA: type IV pili twitching motility protein PilT [Candidatus Omnitrophica bacterium]|nr:MAG: hypothetical protein A2Z81_03520 [Omnitrophica WOR_2 bacterium GWA2_45_18]HBR14361.1 type IV pili twitching motility protein PilT [Candidatus Omnitrophota bacterium]